MSKASSEEVRSTIHAIKPQTVFVELDIGRARKLMSDRHKQDQIKEQGILQARPAALYPSIASWLLARLPQTPETLNMPLSVVHVQHKGSSAGIV